MSRRRRRRGRTEQQRAAERRKPGIGCPHCVASCGISPSAEKAMPCNPSVDISTHRVPPTCSLRLYCRLRWHPGASRKATRTLTAQPGLANQILNRSMEFREWTQSDGGRWMTWEGRTGTWRQERSLLGDPASPSRPTLVLWKMDVRRRMDGQMDIWIRFRPSVVTSEEMMQPDRWSMDPRSSRSVAMEASRHQLRWVKSNR